MKKSPLRLSWITYPAASYELSEDHKGDIAGEAYVAADVSAEVRYQPEGEHFAYLKLKNREGDSDSPYKFSVHVVASFTFDLEIAKREYRGVPTRGLVPMIAVNVCRILYASAREYLSMITSRATYGTAVLDSILLEPTDVQIESDLAPPDLIQTLFGATEEEVAEFKERLSKLGENAPTTSESKKKNIKERV